MPPALSDVESSGDEQIPATKTAKPASPQPDAVDATTTDDEGSVAEDEYVVEEILKHRFSKNGELEFDVKWVGYDDPKDRTWEPESNMEGAIDILDAYFKKIGGRPEPKTGAKRKGRQPAAKSDSVAAADVADSADTRPATAKRVKKDWEPPKGSWEHDVSHVDTVEEELDQKTGEMVRFAYVVWNNQRKTYHHLTQVYQKCPQKMLQYYESHLVFTQNTGLNGEEDMNMKDI